jgi:hypothetical protein
MKRNVIDWISGTMMDATSAIVLTHNIDFLFLQSVVRPRLRKCGHPKLTIFADAACAAGSYRQQRHVLDGLGRHYRVVPVEMGVGRRFHPKAIILSGPSKAALAVGSGNVTHGGWSANHEIWATYESDDDGLPAISAFRNYLESVLNLTSRTESIVDEVASAFDPTVNSWAVQLPEPAGLFGNLGSGPLLERIVELAGNDVQEATICAPYFDPDGAALRELAARIPGRVKTLLQVGHVGLAASAASSLPTNAELNTVDTDPSRFIHAKFFLLRRPATTVLVVGSANISRAALVADGTWGNAELIAVQEIPHAQADELLSDLVISDETPQLPEAPPSDEWEVPTEPLRILMARFADGVLEFSFKSDGKLRELIVEIDDGTKKPCSDYTAIETVHFRLYKYPKFIRLHGVFENGFNGTSEPAWVDDEASLGISAPERRIAAKLIEAAEAGSLSASGMFEILQLLHQHLQQPTSRGLQSTLRAGNDAAPPPRSYSVDDVFSDSFGRPQAIPTPSLPGGFREADFLSVFNAYFSLNNSEEPGNEAGSPGTGEQGADLANEGEPNEIEDSRVKEDIERQQARRELAAEGQRLRKKLVGALENVVKAMGAEEFIEGRSPERLGADIAATALLLRKGLADQILSGDDFVSITGRLWSILFFGSKGEPGALPKKIESSPPGIGGAFEAAVMSPRLTAALTLWCFPDWGHGSTEAIRFRFASMVLAARLPWLIAGAAVDEIVGELRRLSRAMPMGVDFDSLLTAWRNWVRAGVAFREFERAVGEFSAKDLADAIVVNEVKRGDLLWQVGELCIASENYSRDPKTKAVVLPLTGASPRKIIGNWLVPVAPLLEEANILNIHEQASELLLSILAEVQAAEEMNWGS